MRKIKPGAEDELIPNMSDKELDKAWHIHLDKMLKKGIKVTFKPVRFYTEKERDRLLRMTVDAELPPTSGDQQYYDKSNQGKQGGQK